MPFIKGRARESLKSARDGANRASYRFGNATLQYKLLKRVFDRESVAVFHGVREHHRRTLAGTEVFELRRRIHMLEKGLTMQPRRETFGAGYINMVLSRLKRGLELGALGDETIAWARDVLDGYFDATATSADMSIAKARALYRRIDLSSAAPYCGPALPLPPAAAFDPEMIEALASHRRSVRWYDKRPVPREIVDRAVRVAMEAPTACNRVPYQIRIFDDPIDARRVASIAGGTTGYVQNLQAVAVIVGDLAAYGEERDRHLIYIDGSLAAMGLIYALESSGVASCCINWPDIKSSEEQMANLIGLAPYERVVMLVAFGYADPQGLAPASPKLALDEVRSYVRLTPIV